ncbi:MAG TPA: sulfite exporter TauE/SafE family protein [Acidimicrobiia bacterium]|jgi:uncharacterized membrane protein YfcA|nr:sulfite exporter TauE/SafE family protein [Acidimicrobiia bacterium]
MPLTWIEIAIAVVVTAVAAAAQGVVGIGFAVVSVPLLSLVNPVLSPVPQVLMVLPLTVIMAWRERAHADVRGVPWVLAGRLPGALIGLFLLTAATQRALDVLIASIVLAGVAIRASSIRIARNHATELLVGTFAGTASMVASIGGPPMALLYQRERAETIRATLGVVFTVGVLITIVGRALSSQISSDDVRIAAMLFPAMVAGYASSIPMTSRVSEDSVRRGILIVSTIAAVGLVVRAL